MNWDTKTERQTNLERYMETHKLCTGCGYDGSFEAYMIENPELAFRFRCPWCNVGEILGLDYPIWNKERNGQHFVAMLHEHIADALKVRSDAIRLHREKIARVAAKS